MGEVEHERRASEKPVYTQAHMQIIKDLAELGTKQALQLKAFEDHKKEDSDHFDRLYDADKQILDAVSHIPENMMKCRDKLKDDIMDDVEKNFVSATEFKILRTKITWSIITVTALGSVVTTVLTSLVLISKLNGGP